MHGRSVISMNGKGHHTAPSGVLVAVVRKFRSLPSDAQHTSRQQHNPAAVPKSNGHELYQIQVLTSMMGWAAVYDMRNDSTTQRVCYSGVARSCASPGTLTGVSVHYSIDYTSTILAGLNGR